MLDLEAFGGHAAFAELLDYGRGEIVAHDGDQLDIFGKIGSRCT